MRKSLLGFALTTSLIALVAFGQTPSPTETPSPAPMLVSTATPTSAPSVGPNDVGTVSVPSTLSTPIPALSPLESPSATPIEVQAASLGPSDLGWSERGSPVFKIDQAVILALQQNPTIRNALQRSEERRVGKEWRYWRDWSSDVCSSDLPYPCLQPYRHQYQHFRRSNPPRRRQSKFKPLRWDRATSVGRNVDHPFLK